MKDTGMNDLPLHVVFVEWDVGDFSHWYSYDFLTWRVLLFKFKYINGNEVQ